MQQIELENVYGNLSQKQIDSVNFLVDHYFCLQSHQQQVLMGKIKRRMAQLGFDQITINSFGPSKKKSSSNSTIDSSPIHIKKTNSLTTHQQVNEFITQPELNFIQQKINEEDKLSMPNLSMESTNLSSLQKKSLDENYYWIPSKFNTPQKMEKFKLKIIRPLSFLGISGGKIPYTRANQSRNMKKYPYIKQVPDLGLFYMDLVSINGRGKEITTTFQNSLNKIDKFLMFKFQIGMNFFRQELLKIFNIYWQNLIEIVLQRIWTPDGEQQHGLDFFVCKKNLQKIKKILLLGNKLTLKFSESLKNIQLPSLEVLEMNFETQVDHEELKNIFDSISTYNNRFEIHLVTNIKNKNEFPPFLIEKYGERIYLVDKRLKPSVNLQKQKAVEKAKYAKKSYQLNIEAENKLEPKLDQSKKNSQIVNVPILERVISQSNIDRRQEETTDKQLKKFQTQSLGSNENQKVNNGAFSQSQKFNGFDFNVSGNGVVEKLSIGTSEHTINQKTIHQHNTQHHHHHRIQKIIQQIIRQDDSERHYETDYDDRRGGNKREYSKNWSNYGRNRQYESEEESSDDEPHWKTGYQYYGRNNYKYNSRYNNYNKFNGYYKKWYQD